MGNRTLENKAVKQRFGIIGNSPQLNHAIDIAKKVAPTDLSVLITGESGVGKEAFSKIIHQLSVRKHESFIAVNCGAIPEGTIDSELFGHIKGSFTGANTNRKGYFETVDGGTIFLDEVGEMPIETQARLLRVLESGEYIKVGDSKINKTDVRVIAATNVDLIEKVKQGKFREDLYYRLNTVPIHVPPLRERGDDIELLFRKFLTDFAENYHRKPLFVQQDAKRVLLNYRWPGNVRQLKNTAQQVSILSQNDELTAEDLLSVLPKERTDLTIPQQEGFTEREVLYKMLFEMKHDLNNIKSYLWNNDHKEFFDDNKYSDFVSKKQTTSDAAPISLPPIVLDSEAKNTFELYEETDQPYILKDTEDFYDAESFDESLSISDMEKSLIEKALKKHKGTRKKAALDLGISERTLYRKLKEYEIVG